MSRDETNGMLRAVELQLRAVEEILATIDRKGDLADEAFERFRTLKIDLVNLTVAADAVRAWNL